MSLRLSKFGDSERFEVFLENLKVIEKPICQPECTYGTRIIASRKTMFLVQ
jgi:hypothetical protein